jgi:small subunit ribosomal protein S1
MSDPNENPTPESEVTPAAETAATPQAAEPATPPAPAPAEAAATAPVAAAATPAAEEAEAPKKPKIQIGSQRDVAKSPMKPAAVQAALANPVQLDGVEPSVEVETAKIKSNVGLGSVDIDADIDAALAGLSMDAVLDSTEAAVEELELNSRVKGVVTKIHLENDNVFFKLNGQFEGVAAFHHFKEEPKEGDFIEVVVRGRNAEDGLYELSIPGAVIGVADWEDITEGAVVEVMVTGSNTGGLEVKINSLAGFMPMSQIDRFRVDDVSGYINQKLQAVVMEVNPAKRKLVVSRRAILDRENEEKREALMEELEAGQLRDGTVTKLMDFGAFVDLGGAEGLIHVSKVSWTRVKHPSEVLEVGQKVRVKVEKIGDGRISLSHRDTLEHPWKTISGQFTVDEVVTGKVTKVMDFGAFVQLAPGVEGLCHISELAHHRVTRVSTVCNAGDEIAVKILSMDTEAQKMSLSHKATLAAPAPKAGDKKKNEPEIPESRELVVPASGEPLKGGMNEKSGGEQFGLKW